MLRPSFHDFYFLVVALVLLRAIVLIIKQSSKPGEACNSHKDLALCIEFQSTISIIGFFNTVDNGKALTCHMFLSLQLALLYWTIGVLNIGIWNLLLSLLITALHGFCCGVTHLKSMVF